MIKILNNLFIYVVLFALFITSTIQAMEIDTPKKQLSFGELLGETVSPDGKMLATWTTDGRIRIYNAATGDLVKVLSRHRGTVNDAEFSPNSEKLASASADHTVKLWDIATGNCIRTYTEHTDDVNSISFSPDGTKLVSASDDKTVKQWSVDSNSSVVNYWANSNAVSNAIFSPDGAAIYAPDGVDLKKWDAASDNLLSVLSGHMGAANTLIFSGDGNRLLSRDSNRYIRVWQLSNDSAIWSIGASAPGVAISYDGSKVLYSHNDSYIATLRDIEGDSIIDTLEELDSRLNSAKFSADGITILTGSYYDSTQLWDASTGDLLKTFSGHSDYVLSVNYSTDGTKVITRSADLTVKIWDISTTNCLATIDGYATEIRHADFSPDGSKILTVSQDNTGLLWDVATGKVIFTFSAGGGNLTQFSPDGKYILARGTSIYSDEMRLFDLDSLKYVKTFRGHTVSITSAKFNSDGTMFVTGAGDDDARLWHVATGTCLKTFTGHTHDVEDVIFSPDETKILTASYDKSAKLWDITTGNVIKTFTGNPDPLNYASFSPDGTKILTSSSFNQAYRLKEYEIATGEEIYSTTSHSLLNSHGYSKDGTMVLSRASRNGVSLRGSSLQTTSYYHSDLVTSAVFSPSDKSVLSASYDSTAKLWNLSNGSITTFTGHADKVTAAIYSPDETMILTCSEDGSVMLWDNVNDTPSIISTPVLTATEGEEWSYTILVSDPDDTSFNYSMSGGPLGMVISENVLAWTPKNGDTTSGEVVVTVSDGELSVQQKFTISVTPVNDAPTLTTAYEQSMYQDTSITLTLDMTDANDIDSDTLVLIVLDGLNYTVSGNTVTPTAGWTGTLYVKVKVTDGIDTTDFVTMAVNVEQEVAIIEVESDQNDEDLLLSFAPNPVPADAEEAFFVTPSKLNGSWEVIIFDNLGDIIDNAEFSTNGGYTYKWDLRNMHGVKVFPGTYLVQIIWKKPDGSVNMFKRYIGVER